MHETQASGAWKGHRRGYIFVLRGSEARFLCKANSQTGQHRAHVVLHLVSSPLYELEWDAIGESRLKGALCHGLGPWSVHGGSLE